MSGIWCLDVRESFNAPKALSGWSTPEGIEQALEKDIVEADKKLAATGYEVLQDPDGLNLRYYQIEAIQAAEKAIAEHKQTALLAMATGTGKTRTVLGMIYRFLDAGRFKRILYLVDRTSLGDQTMDTFKEVKLKELLTLNQMYDVKSLEDKEFEKDTRVHIATVQSLVKRIMYNESDKSLGVSDYDLVIVDEAHRGYILDKEMGDDEVLYRDQNDFRSKYRAVIDYFDAVKIALTATPALHTTGIFYAQGVKTNVLFFTRGTTDKGNTKKVWFYDLRTNMPSFGKTNPLKAEHFDGFKDAYTAEDRKSISDERWSCYTYDQISEEGKNHSLDLGLIKDDSVLDYDDLPDPIESGEECIAQLEEAVDLLMSVVKELKALEGAE